MIGILQPEEIETVLKSQLVGRIGCSVDGLPYIVPISYVYQDDYVYCHTKRGRKVDMMRENPKVCFQVENMVDQANWKSVVAHGIYEELTTEEDIHQGVQLLLGRYLPLVSSETMHLGRLWPFSPDNDAEVNGIVFRIQLTHKSGRFESDSQSPAIVG
ncbi:MAG: pyridoxamine 5'-phosphate oxidase family protein [Chitinophagaceae bacterium]|nr:MAG: pyridoxamine 5'-phosphate oxidase family protein [Chitinophagaceae bacterium]